METLVLLLTKSNFAVTIVNARRKTANTSHNKQKLIFGAKIFFLLISKDFKREDSLNGSTEQVKVMLAK